MEFSRALVVQLAVLSEALSDPGIDLQEQLHELGQSVRTSVSSFLGLRMTVVVEDYPFTLTALEAGADPTAVGASVAITLGAADRTATSSSVVFYAGTPGAFVDLAADAAKQHPSPGAVVLDAHLDDPDGAHPVAGFTGFSEISVINQALGVIMGGGRTLAQARVALEARAAGTGRGIVATAQAIVTAAATRAPHHDTSDDTSDDDVDDDVDDDDGVAV